MQQSIATGPSQAPVSVHTENGMAEFHRDGPASVTLKLAYRVPDNAATLQQSSLAEGVEALCNAEIEKIRATLAGIAEALAEQLSDEGRTPVFADDSTDHRDRRTWDDRGSSLSVDASITAFENHLGGFEGVADSQLVRASIDATIRARENSIRNVYKQILVDVSARRGSIPSRELQAKFSPRWWVGANGHVTAAGPVLGGWDDRCEEAAHRAATRHRFPASAVTNDAGGTGY